MSSDFWTKIIMLIVVLHFVAGFAYLIFKLSPQKKQKNEDGEELENEDVF